MPPTEPQRPVNFVHRSSPNYRGVQQQLFDLIRVHMPPDRPATDTVDEPLEHAVNLGLHIRMGSGPKQLPIDCDVLMSHGVADKSYLFLRAADTDRPLLHSYEHVLVPGRWLKDRMLGTATRKDPRMRIELTEDRIHVVGWPRLDPLLQAAARGERFRLRLRRRRTRVLWAPSHDSQRVGTQERRLSSYPAFEEHLPRLRKSFDVQVSVHPRNRRNKTPTMEPLLWADVVISDFGTMLYEAWALGKCVIFPHWLMPPEIMTRHGASAEGHIYAQRIGNHADDIDELVEMARAHEPPGPDVTAFLDAYLAPEYRGCSGQRIASLLPTLPLRRLGS